MRRMRLSGPIEEEGKVNMATQNNTRPERTVRRMTWAVLAVILMSVAGHAAPLMPGPETVPLWDGKESVADYARRVGINDIEITVDLGNGVSMKLALIPAGKFLMGAETGKKSEQPAHEVTLTSPCYMGVVPVTAAQVAQAVGMDPATVKDPAFPARVTWDSAVACCKKVGEKAARIGRLPTEAEWEFACRAGTTNSYFFGEDDKAFTKLANYAWVQTNSMGQLHPVGLKKPNDWGLYDLYGPVFQWVADWHAPYTADAQTDPTGPSEGKARVLRGADIDRSPARSSGRSSHPPSVTAKFGFRVVLEVQ